MWNVLWGHISAQRLALEGLDHFPTLETESDSNCVLPWLITGWENRPSQQHNSIWAKYLYRGERHHLSTTHSFTEGRATSRADLEGPTLLGQRNITSSCWHLLRLSEQHFVLIRVHHEISDFYFWGDSHFVSDWKKSSQWWVDFFCTVFWKNVTTVICVLKIIILLQLS